MAITERSLKARDRLYAKSMQELRNNYHPVVDLDPNEAGMFGDIAFALDKKALDAPKADPDTNVGQVYIVKRVVKWRYDEGLSDHDRTLVDEINILKLVKGWQQKSFNEHFPTQYITEILRHSPDNIWYSMEAVEGPTLQKVEEYLKESYEPTNPGRQLFAISIAQQLIEAVHWLHTPIQSKPWMVVHGDLHVGNVMLDLSTNVPSASKAALPGLPVPSVRLIDFGAGLIKDFDPGHVPTHAEDISEAIGDDDRSTIHEFQVPWDTDYENLRDTIGLLFPKPTVKPEARSTEAIYERRRVELMRVLKKKEERRIDVALGIMTKWTAFAMSKGPQTAGGLAELVEGMRAIVMHSYNAPVSESDILKAMNIYYSES